MYDTNRSTQIYSPSFYHNDPVSSHLKEKGVERVILDNLNYLIAHKAIRSLGYSDSSIKAITKRCSNRRLAQVRSTRGIITINLITVNDFLEIILTSTHTDQSIVTLRQWIIGQIFNSDKCIRITNLPELIPVESRD